MKRVLFSLLSFLSLCCGSVVFSTVANAQVDTGLNQVGQTIALPATDPRVIATRIINISLGLLAIIMVTLMVYAGFVWMTAGGDAAKVDQAKAIIRNSIIGVIIILMSWAIARYVIEKIFAAAGGGGGGVTTTGPSGGGGFGGGGGGLSFQVRSISPTGDVSIRNIEVRFLFTNDIDATQAQTAITVLKASDNTPVAGTIAVTADTAVFTPSAACPTDATRKCFDANTEYIARVNNTLHSATGQGLACGATARPCEARFKAGSVIDSTGPTVVVTQPFSGQSVPQDDAVTIGTHVTDDTGVGSVESLVNASVVGRDGPTGTTTASFDATVLWNTTGLATGTYAITSRAFDIDSNSSVSQASNVVIRPRHCFNGSKDADETAIDCGGSDCGACTGGACSTGASCASGVCTGGVCVDQPIILGVDPKDGRPGTYVTVSGVNFGSTPGSVTIGGKIATAPTACVSANASTWSYNQIIVAVPAGGVSGPVIVTTSNKLSDASNDSRGPILDDFQVNTVARPGLCAADPYHGLPGANVDLIGIGLGSTRGQVTMTGDRDVTTITNWTDSKVSFNAPVFSPGSYDTHIQSGATSSNNVLFTIDSRQVTSAPRIDAIDPTPSPVGGYITLQGAGFGDLPNRVMFKSTAPVAEGQADVNFPQACSNNYWHDTSIVVKVPASLHDGLGNAVSIKPGQYQVTVIRQSDQLVSNIFNFTVGSGTPGPGLCAIVPIAGPIGTTVSLVGENFGGTVGNVYFKGTGTSRIDASINANAWNAGQVTTTVPTGALTGAVSLRAAGGQLSNTVAFQVKNCNEDASICGKGEICCQSGACSTNGACPATTSNARFAWQTSTGRIPINPEVVEECSAKTISSPSPWDRRSGGNQACLNADIMLRFTTHLNPATVIPANVLVLKCTGTGTNPCSASSPVPGSLLLSQASPEQDFIRFRPATLLDASATYQVTLKTAITSEDPLNIPMRERASDCGAGNGYCFRFVTRQTVCEVGSVAVAPDPSIAQEVGQKMPFIGSGRALGDECIHLNLSNASWIWSTVGDNGAPDARAAFDPPFDQETATATALVETGRDPVRMQGKVQTANRSATGTANLFINFVPPRVISYGPNCQNACANAAVWAKFNIPINTARLTARSIIIKHCTNENCRAFTNELDLNNVPIAWSTDPLTSNSRPNTYLRIDPVSVNACTRATLLEPDQFYRVILRRDDFTSQSSNLPLENANDPEGFAWNFRVRANPDARCTAATVSVTPVQKVETQVGARQLFDADPVSAADQCNSNGQPLVADQSFGWTSSDVQVATLRNGGNISISSNLPASCTEGLCLNKGSDGVMGHVASCGNGILETTDDKFCVNGKHNGASCVLLPAGSKGAEECDLGAANGPSSSCSNRCLLNPVNPVTATPAGSCGNGKIDPGEQCDPNRICVGGQFDGTVCTSDIACGAGSSCKVVERLGCSDHCQLLGATAGASTCGNRDLGDGEACDDGNTQNGDGCSADCLHEGSDPVRALCGNGVIEPGESCDNVGGVWPANCDQKTCLNLGTDTCPAGGGKPGAACCGNGVQDPGEDNGCDKGVGVIGEDCTNRCLKKGASIGYTTPSICGDGAIGAGEQCDVSAAASVCGGGPRQLAEISGLREPTPAESDNIMRSNINASYDNKTGTGVYGLQCGFTHESDCQAGFGLTTGGCCAPRPKVVASNPASGETNVCRNALISVTFDTLMDEASMTDNLILAKKLAGTTCPAGTTKLTLNDEETPHGILGWIKNIWKSLLALVTGKPAYAQVYCAGQVTGTVRVEQQKDINGKAVSQAFFVIDHALDPSTDYRLLIQGDRNLTDALKQGAHSSRGVVIDGATAGGIIIDFQSGKIICGANAVNIQDTNLTSSFLFTKNPEAHDMTATVLSNQGGRQVPIVSVQEYGWDWQPWTSSEEQHGILYVASTKVDPSNAMTTSTIENRSSKNGSSDIATGIKITRDVITIPSTVGSVIDASKVATVMICERPWPFVDPRYQSTTFFDAVKSPFLPGLLKNGPFYQFSSLYCLDQGQPGPDDDLPMLTVNATAIGANDQLKGIKRQFLMKFEDASLAADGIGIRVIDNPLHLSASSWYKAQSFGGSPQTVMIDGYEAVKDASTLYVSAANADNDPSSGNVTTSIYLISHNPNAQTATMNIYKQLVDNLIFNINFNSQTRNACVDASGAIYQSNGKSVPCTADWECVNYSTTANPLTCASSKAKLRRDVVRISDFQNMSATLETSKAQTKTYPSLSTGSFLQSMTNSLWSSWDQNLAASLNGPLPKDPVNRFITCGRCLANSTLGGPCMSNSDCKTGETCAAQVDPDPNSAKNNYDPATCWNATSRRYLCPSYNGVNSSIYQYRSVDLGARYELATQLEFAAGDRYKPALVTEVKTCSNTGQLCQVNADCNIYAVGDTTKILSSGICTGTGGRWLYSNVCGNRQYGINTVCGDGVRGENEVCETGDILPVSCTTSDGRAGTKTQVCSDCQGFVDTPASICTAVSLCGNGRIDRNVCAPLGVSNPGYKNGQSCSTPTPGTVSAECGDTRDASLATGGAPIQMTCQSLPVPETCDDGALNGSYGRCNRTCSGIDAYCGDGYLSPGESCDNGLPSTDPTRPTNGDYCGAGCDLSKTCSLDCRGRAPYCGDRIVQTANEQCDGNTETTNKALCVNPNNLSQSSQKPCDINSDCSAGEVCPSDPSTDPALYVGAGPQAKACGTDTVKLCTNSASQTACSTDADCSAGGHCQSYPSVKTRTCKNPGTTNQCTWNGWSKCQAASFCGDGRLDPGEECDDGNTNNNDSCTNSCKRNVCGDAVLYTGVEECDLGNAPLPGAKNGLTCSAEYGSTCSRCSTQCRMEAISGGYCGNNVKEDGELCDGTDGTANVTCRSLGFDYAKHVKCVHDEFWIVKQDILYTGNQVLYPVGRVVDCGNDDTCKMTMIQNASKVDHYAAATAITDPAATIPSIAAGTVCSGRVDDAISCTQTCGFDGCQRCSDPAEPGNQASISGQVFDAVYSIFPVPNARVTLYSNGVRVTEAFTDADGRFTLNALNNFPICNSYRIVVDFYQDNPCTGSGNTASVGNPPSCNGQRWTQTFDVNEATRGGYWPYESKTFSASTFASNGVQDPLGNIYLIPRVGANETLVVDAWQGRILADNTTGEQIPGLGNEACSEISSSGPNAGDLINRPPNSYHRFLDAHLLIPSETGYKDVDYSAPGSVDLAQDPNAKLFCYKRCTADTSCNSFETGPQTTKFRRNTDFVADSSGNPAKVSYYLVDYKQNNNRPGWQFQLDVNSRIRIVTQNDYYEVTPPPASPSCNGTYWHVFDQDVQTGAIDFLSLGNHGTYECTTPAGLSQPFGATP